MWFSPFSRVSLSTLDLLHRIAFADQNTFGTLIYVTASATTRNGRMKRERVEGNGDRKSREFPRDEFVADFFNFPREINSISISMKFSVRCQKKYYGRTRASGKFESSEWIIDDRMKSCAQSYACLTFWQAIAIFWREKLRFCSHNMNLKNKIDYLCCVRCDELETRIVFCVAVAQHGHASITLAIHTLIHCITHINLIEFISSHSILFPIWMDRTSRIWLQ